MGLTPVEPLADVEVNVPGMMAMLVAPAVVQLRVLLAPELMAAGSAAKETMVGAEPLPGDELDEPPQPTSPTTANRIRSSPQRVMGSRELSLFLEDELVEFMRKFPIVLVHRNRRRSFLRTGPARGEPLTVAHPPTPYRERACFRNGQANLIQLSLWLVQVVAVALCGPSPLGQLRLLTR